MNGEIEHPFGDVDSPGVLFGIIEQPAYGPGHTGDCVGDVDSPGVGGIPPVGDIDQPFVGGTSDPGVCAFGIMETP